MYDELRRKVEVGMLCGFSIETVNERVIEPAEVVDDVRAALWLYALTFMSKAEQRRFAFSHLELIDKVALEDAGRSARRLNADNARP